MTKHKVACIKVTHFDVWPLLSNQQLLRESLSCLLFSAVVSLQFALVIKRIIKEIFLPAAAAILRLKS